MLLQNLERSRKQEHVDNLGQAVYSNAVQKVDKISELVHFCTDAISDYASKEERLMITVVRRTYIQSVTPEQVFAALSEPKNLTQLLPRVRKAEIKGRDANNARLVTYMSLGGIFGTIRCEGNLKWVEPREIVFEVEKPLPLETRWVLTSGVNGTDLQATMLLDLIPLLGPMAQFVPTNAVADLIGAELDQALKAITERCATLVTHERAVAA
jgi:hypothetical protein